MIVAADRDIDRRTFRLWLLGILLTGALVRGLFPAADPPWRTTVGVVWHDEGAWVHNARNKALFGAWSADAWNPMYVAPVFTGLEYLSFATLGVGVKQARLVPELLGLLSVALIGLGVARLGGHRAGLVAAALLATNYVYVMWNRAALMEGPMTAFMVASWYCYTRAAGRASWAWAAAAAALLAFFTKAAAAFFVAGLALDALASLAFRRSDAAERRRALGTLAGLAVCGAIAAAVFVLPNWTDYWFYNVQMSVTRKPSYDLQSVMNRITWFPILHDLFTRMWFTLLLAVAGLLTLLSRWGQTGAGERLLAWWIGLGALELLVHDVGNERRFVFFIPALVALAALVLARDRRLLPEHAGRWPAVTALAAAPVLGYLLYVLFGAIVRVLFLYEVRPNVRLAAALAAVSVAAIFATWPRVPRALGANGWTIRGAVGLTVLVVVGQVAQYGQWAWGRTYKNYEASRALGEVLPPGTLVHGKLANGLALENEIRPIFVGRGFGNYDDRARRDDVRYILTYIAPRLGFESQKDDPIILDVLDAYPGHTTIMTFDVAETATGHDRAALIDKFGGQPERERPAQGRAHD